MTENELIQILKGAKAPFPTFGATVSDIELAMAKKVLGNYPANETSDALIELLNKWGEKNRPPTITEIKNQIHETRKAQARLKNWENERRKLNYKTHPDPIREQLDTWETRQEFYEQVYGKKWNRNEHQKYLESMGGGYRLGKIAKAVSESIGSR